MRYGLYPDLFGDIERCIEQGLYKRALAQLHNIRQRLTPRQKILKDILTADIFSRTGRFAQAFDLRREHVNQPPADPFLKSILYYSHAFTLGYTGHQKPAVEHFFLARDLTEEHGRAFFFYACEIGCIDIVFHDYNFDRFFKPHNDPLLYRIDDLIEFAEGDERLSHRERRIITAQLHFRQAVLHWLNEEYAPALVSFAETYDRSSTFFRTWALFGALNCSIMLDDDEQRRLWQSLLARHSRESAWRKNAMRYWPVALLIGRTLRITGDAEKEHTLYRDILLTIRNEYANNTIDTPEYAVFITQYFYPVYLEAVKGLLASGRSYRYVLNRAEMFRSRFLSEEYKRSRKIQGSGTVLSPNIRIDAIGSRLNREYNGDIAFLYCFDFRETGVLLLSRDLVSKYERIDVDEKDYRYLDYFTGKPALSFTDIRQMSDIFEGLLERIGTSRLIVIPHGIFNYIPFHALIRSRRPLLADTLVTYWPSLQMAMLGERKRSIADPEISLIGTRSDKDSVQEVRELAGLFQKPHIVMDPDDTQLRDELSGNRGIGHFVTHGTYGRPGEDITVVMFDKREVQLTDVIDAAEHTPRIVLLNVCFGGLAIHADADILVGVPVAFFRKGTETMLMSGRRVEKKFSLYFSRHLYKELLIGKDVGDAYRRAILESDEPERALAQAPALMGNSRVRVRFVANDMT